MRTRVHTGRLVAIAVCAAALALAFAIPSVAFANDVSSATTATLPVVNQTGSLSATGEAEAVYAVYLQAGKTVAFTLAGQAGTDFDLGLFSPSATSVADVGSVVGSSLNTGTSAEKIVYLVPASGYYFVDVSARTGAGTYTLNAKLDMYTVTTPMAPNKIKHKVPFTAVTFVSPRYISGGHPVRFIVQRFEHGKWVTRLTGNAGKPGQDKKRGRTAYAVRIWLTKGSWRIRASFSDSLHAIQNSGFHKIKVS